MKEFLKTGIDIIKDGFVANGLVALISVLFGVMFHDHFSATDMVCRWVVSFIALFIMDILFHIFLDHTGE